MKFNKQIAIILVLGSLLLSALGAAYYFYTVQTKTISQMSQKVKVYVVGKPLKATHQFTEDDLKEHLITKQELITKPLGLNEIVGKYAKVDMFENEMIIKEKISDTLVETKEDPIKTDYKNNSYNMSFRMFQNPNYTLKKGDIVNIVSTYPVTADKLPKYSVQYVAKDVEVLGFILYGSPVAEVFNKQKVIRTINKKEVEIEENVKADELVLDIKSDILLNLINDFNRGNQLWMVKTKSAKDQEQVAKTETTTIVESGEVGQTPVVKAVINYPYKWYTPRDGTRTKVATIEYADNMGKNITQEAVFKSDVIEKCLENREKLLIVGVNNSAFMRTQPTIRSKAIATVYRNMIIPFESKVDSWYRTCDGLYIHENTVKEISLSDAKKKLNEK